MPVNNIESKLRHKVRKETLCILSNIALIFCVFWLQYFGDHFKTILEKNSLSMNNLRLPSRKYIPRKQCFTHNRDIESPQNKKNLSL